MAMTIMMCFGPQNGVSIGTLSRKSSSLMKGKLLNPKLLTNHPKHHRTTPIRGSLTLGWSSDGRLWPPIRQPTLTFELKPAVPQRAQYPVIKEYSLNHNMKPYII